MSDPSDHRYDAFISYRHKPLDRKWAQWLVDGLETFKVPKGLIDKGAQDGIGRVFRDEDELPSSADLGEQLQQALRESRYLIVICSKDTPHSQWVNAEVQAFRDWGRHDRILALLVDGEPSESFPEALGHIKETVTQPDGTTTDIIKDVEPLAADVRPRTDEPEKVQKQKALLRIIATLIGVRYDDLWQRHGRRQQRKRRILAAAALAMTIAGTALTYQYINTIKAEQARTETQRNRAEEKADALRNALNNLKGEQRQSSMRRIATEIERATAPGQKFALYRGAMALLAEDADAPHISNEDKQDALDGLLALASKTHYAIKKTRFDLPVIAMAEKDEANRWVVIAGDAYNRETVAELDVERGVTTASHKAKSKFKLTQLSPKGRFIARVTFNNRLRLFDTRSGNQIGQDIKLNSNPEAICIAGAGDRLGVITYGRKGGVAPEALLLDAQGVEIGQRFSHAALGQSQSQCGFTDDGHHWGVWTRDGAMVMDTAANRAIGQLRLKEGRIIALRLNSDTLSITAVTETGLVEWQFSGKGYTSKPLDAQDAGWAFWKDCTSCRKTASFSADGRLLQLTASELTDVAAGPSKIAVWDLQTQTFSKPWERIQFTVTDHWLDGPRNRVFGTTRSGLTLKWALRNRSPASIAFEFSKKPAMVRGSRDGLALIAAVGDTVAWIPLRQQSPLGPSMAHTDAVTSVVIHPTQNTLISGSADQRHRRWNMQTGQAISESVRLSQPISQVLLNAAGNQYLTASGQYGMAGGTVFGWAMTGIDKSRFSIRRDADISHMAIAHDQTQFAVADGSGLVQTYALKTGESLSPVFRHHKRVYKLAYRPDSQVIATASADKTVRLWHAKTGVLQGNPLKHESGVTDVHWSPKKTELATATDDGHVYIWAFNKGTKLLSKTKAKGHVSQLEFNEDGTELLVASGQLETDTGHVGRLQTSTGQWVGDGIQFALPVTRMAFDEARSVMAIGVGSMTEKRGSLALYDMASQKRIGRPIPMASAVRSLTVSKTGSRLVAGLENGQVRVLLRDLFSPQRQVAELAKLTNYRICRSTLIPKLVNPYPAGSRIWAPPELCKDAVTQ